MQKDTLNYIASRAEEHENGSIKAVDCGNVRALLTERAELIAALESLLKRAESLDQSATHDGLQNADAIAQARAAIQKAKG